MAIFTLKQINDVVSLEDDLQKNYDKITHIKDCYQVLKQSLLDHFENNYLFHTSYFLDEQGIFHHVDFDIHLPDSKKIAKIIEEGANLLENGKVTFSFTKSMCEKRKQVLCLFKSNKELNYPRLGDLILTQHLDDSEIVSNISTFFEENPTEVQTLIEYYQKIALINPTSNYYIYFIRPFTTFNHYNGVFSIFLSKRLKESELIELGTIWTKVLSDTAVIEVKKEKEFFNPKTRYKEKGYNTMWSKPLMKGMLSHLEKNGQQCYPIINEKVEHIIKSFIAYTTNHSPDKVGHIGIDLKYFIQKNRAINYEPFQQRVMNTLAVRRALVFFERFIREEIDKKVIGINNIRWEELFNKMPTKLIEFVTLRANLSNDSMNTLAMSLNLSFVLPGERRHLDTRQMVKYEDYVSHPFEEEWFDSGVRKDLYALLKTTIES